jgi:hypothetical protein
MRQRFFRPVTIGTDRESGRWHIGRTIFQGGNMIFHMSIAADNPERAARIIAEVWQGSAHPFPPFARGGWIAMSGDGRNSAIEIHPRGAETRDATLAGWESYLAGAGMAAA